MAVVGNGTRGGEVSDRLSAEQLRVFAMPMYDRQSRIREVRPRKIQIRRGRNSAEGSGGAVGKQMETL